MIVPELLRNSPRRKHPEVDRLARLLIPPFNPNHQPGHPVLAPIWARELDESAKAFEFDVEALDAIDALMRTRRRTLHIYETCRAPAPCCFFEMPDRGSGTHLGLFSERDWDSVRITKFIRDEPSNVVVPLLQIHLNFDVGYSSVRQRFFWGDCCPSTATLTTDRVGGTTHNRRGGRMNC